MFQAVQRRCRAVGRARCAFKRDGHRGQHPGDGRVDPRQQHRVPQESEQQQIERQLLHPAAVARKHDAQDRSRGGERDEVYLGRIEKRDDRDRAHVVDDRDGDEEQLQRRRRTLAEQRQHAHCKGDVGRRGNRPPLGQSRRAAGKSDVDHRGDGHARCGRDERQPPAVPAREPPIDELALDLQPDEQEENRHQPVIDPQMDRHRAKLVGEDRPGHGMNGMLICLGKRRIGDNHRQNGRENEQHAARAFARQKSA